MNIKEFLSWRPNCYFCQKELLISPKFPDYRPHDGEKVKCLIEDELILFKSSKVNISIDIISGLIQALDNNSLSSMIYFIASQPLNIEIKCPWCDPLKRHYSHSGIFIPDKSKTHYIFADICEDLWYDQFCIFQRQSDYSAVVKQFDRDSLAQIPYLDFSKITFDKLTNKLKTYLVFL